NPKQNDMPSTTPNMQRAQTRADLVAWSRPGNGRPALQTGQARGQQIAIRGSLRGAKPFRGPTQDIVVVRFGRVRQPDRPSTACHPEERPSTFSARAARWRRNAAPSAKLRERPAGE